MRVEPGSSERCQGIGQEATGRNAREVPLEHEKELLTVQVTMHWNRLPRGAVESPSLEIVKNRLHEILCNVL